MNILAIDTALGAGTVAVSIGDRIVQTAALEEPRSLSELLVPTIDSVLQAAGMEYSALDRIAVTIGPGTFTGLRIGLAAARAIGLAAGCPVIGVTTLEALANGAREQAGVGDEMCVAIDARRGQVYFQRFHYVDGDLVPSMPAAAVDILSIEDHLPEGPIVAVGTGAAYVLEARPDSIRLNDCFDRIDDEVLCRLARRRADPGEAPAPLYLREPDAKLPKVL